MNYLNPDIKDLKQFGKDKQEEYLNGEPFPNIVFNDFFNEDVFWSLEVNRKKKQLKIPDYKKALCFSIEFKPEHAFALNKNHLPFGCHAWDCYIDFWRPVFKNIGYNK